MEQTVETLSTFMHHVLRAAIPALLLINSCVSIGSFIFKYLYLCNIQLHSHPHHDIADIQMRVIQSLFTFSLFRIINIENSGSNDLLPTVIARVRFTLLRGSGCGAGAAAGLEYRTETIRGGGGF
jgi:hypothetical protein